MNEKSMETTESQALTTVENSPLFQNFAEQYQMTSGAMVTTLIQTVFPHGERDPKPTWSQLAMFMSVANQYRLNPFTRQIYAFPDKNGGVVPIVPVDGWVSLIQREQSFDGFTFKYHWDEGTTTDGTMPPKVDGKVVKIAAITAIIYRKDQTHPTEVTEFLTECFRATSPWQTMTIRMLRHKALMQCGRYAFGLGGIYDEDEARDIIQGGELTTTKFDREAYVEQKKAELADPLPIEQDSSDGLKAQKDESRKSWEKQLSDCKTAADLNTLLPKVKKAPDEIKVLTMQTATRLGLKFGDGAFYNPSDTPKPTEKAAKPAAVKPEPKPTPPAENQDAEPVETVEFTRVLAKVTDVEKRKKGDKVYVLLMIAWKDDESDADIEIPVFVWHKSNHDALMKSMGQEIDADLKRNQDKDEKVWYSLETIYRLGDVVYVDNLPSASPSAQQLGFSS